MEALSQSVLPTVLALQDARWDFAGAPRAAAAIVRVRPVVAAAQLSLAADLALSYFVALAGGTARNLLLSEPLAPAAAAQAFLPIFVAVWLLAVTAPSLLLFLPTRLAVNAINALSRIRSVAGAVAAASVALGPGNPLGVALVGIAQAAGQTLALVALRRLLGQPPVAGDTATLGFPVVSAVAAGAGLAATHGGPHHGAVLATLTLWFVGQAVLATLASALSTAPPTKKAAAKDKKDKKE